MSSAFTQIENCTQLVCAIKDKIKYIDYQKGETKESLMQEYCLNCKYFLTDDKWR
jgi:hypothetical protein